MEIFVRFTVFESINEPAAVERVRAIGQEQIQRLQKSGNLVDARVFADQRGGYMLLDVEDGAELQELIGLDMADHYDIETHPTTSLEEISRLFDQAR